MSSERDKKESVTADRRSADRILNLGGPLYLYPLSSPDQKKIDAITDNVSRTGMSIFINKKLEIGSKFEIHCRTMGERRNGQVVWCKRTANAVYQVGLSFF
jgi:hypothetical protein